ncbi:putative tetraspanin-3-like [Capsicum annuum]|nr:putative tetraspanin-3-like [Capsicum annuum]KAF3659886.1 putative tetraspanin-3-like [Capsicum annuum]
MEKLINLRHPDISNTSRLKMPLHLSKLKCLQVIVGAKFLLGGSCGWRMEDLGELHNLYGSLSILVLQNVVDRREAQKANMKGMNHVEKLSLEWIARDADNSQTERDILDELRPHTNIKELQISGYRGMQFPNWLADHSFLKLLVQLSLSNCKDCFSLPALGQLPCLKFLSIRGMHRITEVAVEFYVARTRERRVSALRKLSIKDCPKLLGKFPENLCSLAKLRITGCPELNLETPIQLSSLKRFEVVGSRKAGVVFDEAELFTSQLDGMKQIEELDISHCNSLTSLPTSTLPSTLKKIRIESCQKLKLEAPDSIGSKSTQFVDTELQNLTRFLIPNGTETLDISWCENLEILLSVACGTQMTSLDIHDCKKLKRLPERMQELLPSLKKLQLSSCPEIESFPDRGLPVNLQLLEIIYCEKLSLLEQGLPSSISKLTINDCPNLQSVPESALPSSLSKLTIEDCPNLQSLPVKGMPSSLSKLSIRYCPLLKPLLEFDNREYWSKIAHIPELFDRFAESLRSAQMLEYEITISQSGVVQSLSCIYIIDVISNRLQNQLPCLNYDFGNNILAQLVKGKTITSSVICQETELFNLVFAVLNPSILGIAGKSMNCQKLCNQKLNRYGTYGSNETQRRHSIWKETKGDKTLLVSDLQVAWCPVISKSSLEPKSPDTKQLKDLMGSLLKLSMELCNLVFVVLKSANSWNHREEHEWLETTQIKNADEDLLHLDLIGNKLFRD